MKNVKVKNVKERNRDRRGIAIELALIVLVFVFVLGALLVSLAVIEAKRIDTKSQELTERAELDKVGESFCNAVAENSISSWRVDGERYKSIVSQSGNVYTLTLYKEEENEALLNVSLEKNAVDNTYKITLWDYQ